jgi:hypothetical protein
MEAWGSGDYKYETSHGNLENYLEYMSICDIMKGKSYYRVYMFVLGCSHSITPSHCHTAPV